MSRFKASINCHSHTDSSLDGASTIKQIIKRHKELGATHVAVTDHGVMNGLMDLYTTSKTAPADERDFDYRIKPIAGIELYLESPFKDFLEEKIRREFAHLEPAKLEGKVKRAVKEAYVHLTVHFKDEIAYRYFCTLTPKMEERAIVRWGERKPIATLDELSGISGHITICSGCLVGAVSKWLLPDNNRPDLADKMYEIIREIAGPDNFFVEIFPHEVNKDWVKPVKNASGIITVKGYFKDKECTQHGIEVPNGDIQKIANVWLMEKAKRRGDRCLISLDSHFALPKHKIIQDAKIGNGEENWVFANSYHIMSTDDCAAVLQRTLGINDKTVEEWVDNSYAFASLFDDFKLTTNKDRWVIESAGSDYLQRIKVAIDRYGRMDWNDQNMVARLKKEIHILAENGAFNLLSYYFTIEEMAEFCKANEILMNVRGSAGGSLLLYLMGVSAVNPLKHNLSFERFITLGRIKANTLPDVDMDIATGGRDQLVDHLKEKYGDRFCRISTDGLLKLKSSIKDAERAIKGRVSYDTEMLCKSLPMEGQGTNSRDLVFGKEEKNGGRTPGLLETNSKLKAYSVAEPEVWATVTEMLGIQRQKGGHACGSVIADKPVQEYVPTIVVGKERVTAYSPKGVEAAGLVKYDLLGLNTLRDIQGCLQSVKHRLGITIDPWNLPEEEPVFQELWNGNTVTVFQFDTDTVRPYLVATKPKSREDLAAITSLCRPGCLDADSGDGRTLADVYVSRSKGEPTTYVHDDLSSIFSITYGIALYQEQSMAIFNKLAGYDDEKTETVRRGIGKKDKKVLESCMGDLKKGCLNRGWTEAQVDLLISQIMASARYSFNKSHAISYAYVAYACMWLKYHYPLDWYKSVLSNASKDELASKFWRHVRNFVELPDVNSASDSYVIKGDKLIAPLSIVTGIGEKAYAQLIENAPYTSLDQFTQVHMGKKADKTRSAVHSGVAQKLVAAGLMDSLFEKTDSVPEKLTKLEVAIAKARGKKKPEPIPSKYTHVSTLGEYLMKKNLISIYSRDLRDIMLPNRGGKKTGNVWQLQPWGSETQGKVVMDGHEFESYRKAVAAHPGKFQKEVACLGYVVSESTIEYSGKTKRATKMVVDVNGTFYEEVLWPPKDGSQAENGFEGIPVVLHYSPYRDKIYLRGVVRLLGKEQVDNYDVT